ncbi:transposase [Mycolicibacterium sp. CH28]|uniref:transposase n=1 Tax=Mycolicibacterium sp. CH28 TaxID=2512237 RepID=UPI0019129F84|nr:transposase [Mycolicibacterium sp. CH28]
MISGLLPSNEGRRGHPFGDDRRVVEGIVYRYRTGIPWRDLPRAEFGPWQTVWKRHRRYAGDGTWDGVLIALLAMADTTGRLDWTVSIDATINRAHQHATNTTRPDQDTGGWVELHESATARVRTRRSRHWTLARRADHQDPGKSRGVVGIR